jgi:glycosyltransferase involved in cell wall biosynthesis
MKVLFLSPSASLGGAEQVLLTMTAMLRRHCPDLDLTVLTLGQGPLIEILKERGVKTVEFRVPRNLEQLGDSGIGALGKIRIIGRTILALPALGKVRREFREAVRALRPDLIHSNGIKTHLLASFAGISGVPVIWHIHDFYGSRPLARRLLAWSRRGCSEAIAISQAIADDFQAVVGSRPISLIANAIDLDRFRPRARENQFPDESAAPTLPGTLRVGMVATYARWKGQEIFFQAAAKILRNLPGFPVQFYLIGGPVYRTAGSQYQKEELRKRTLELGISEKMQLICFHQKPERLYSNLDIVVHASTKPEPFGLTIVEAMACGRPVIASVAGGVSEIIEDGKDALGVPPGDADCLVGALHRLLHDPDLRVRLGTNARGKVEKLFDQERIGPQLWRVYERVLKGTVDPFSSVPPAATRPNSV